MPDIHKKYKKSFILTYSIEIREIILHSFSKQCKMHGSYFERRNVMKKIMEKRYCYSSCLCIGRMQQRSYRSCSRCSN